MRRADREITGRDELSAIVEKGDVCRIALNTGRAPYIIPLNYGYEWNGSLSLYFHCAAAGRKLDLLARDGNAGFEIDIGHVLVTDSVCCGWGMNYQSVSGWGELSVVSDSAERVRAMDLIMRHYGFEGPTGYDPAILARTCLLRLDVAELTGKRKGPVPAGERS